jgi:hypothetical protein
MRQTSQRSASPRGAANRRTLLDPSLVLSLGSDFTIHSGRILVRLSPATRRTSSAAESQQDSYSDFGLRYMPPRNSILNL